MAQHWDPPSQRGQEAQGGPAAPGPALFIEGHVFHPSSVGFQKSSKQWHVSCPCFCSSETSGICRMSFAFPLVPSGTLRPGSFGVQEVPWEGFFSIFRDVFPLNPCWCLWGSHRAVGLQVPTGREGVKSHQGLNWNIMARHSPLGLVAPGAARTPPSFPEAGDGNCPVLLQLLLGQLTAHMARAGKTPWECQEPVRDQHPLWRGHSPILHLLLPRGTHSHLRQSPVLPSRLGDPCGHQQWAMRMMAGRSPDTAQHSALGKPWPCSHHGFEWEGNSRPCHHRL